MWLCACTARPLPVSFSFALSVSGSRVVARLLFCVILFGIFGTPQVTSTIETVLPDTPAQRAGLLNGDQITTINGKSIENPETDII